MTLIAAVRTMTPSSPCPDLSEAGPSSCMETVMTEPEEPEAAEEAADEPGGEAIDLVIHDATHSQSADIEQDEASSDA